METLDFLKQKFNLDYSQKLPIILNISRFKELPVIFRDLGFKKGAEIGVANGRYSKVLCQKIPGLKLFCIDPWLPYSEYVEHHDEAGRQILNNCFTQAKQRLALYNCEFIKQFSMRAAKMIEDNSLDFVFIDGNHSFEYVVNDIAQWTKKVRLGGIISGHDYWRSFETRVNRVLTPAEKIKLCQVKDAVQSWTYANQIKPWFVIAVDKSKSWMWVKDEI